MNKHLDDYLCKKYPKIFADRHKPMNETCMCWGFDCGNGWFFLLDQLCSSIQNHIDNPQYVIPKTLPVYLKRLWNKTVWNWVLYPIGRRVFLRSKQPTEKQWKRWQSFQNRWCLNWDHVPGPKIPQVVAAQVKEKFGGLRFYVCGGDEYTRAMIDFAESLSYSICEDCGRTDELVATNRKGWMRTTCPCHTQPHLKDDHRDSVNKELLKVWEKVHEEEQKKNIKSRADENGVQDALSRAKEVLAQAKKTKNQPKEKSKNDLDLAIETLKQVKARKNAGK